MLGERLKAARRLAGLSQERLGDAIGVSSMSISKYESGKLIPDGVRLSQLAVALDVRTSDLLAADVDVVLSPASFRRHPLKRRSRREEEAIEARARRWLERYIVLEELLGKHAERSLIAQLRGFDSGASDPEAAAAHLRQHWELGQGPIESVVDVLEDNGVKVLAVDSAGSANAASFEVDGADAAILISRYLPGTDKKCPGARERFSLAHEVAHFICDSGHDSKQAEAYADRFAAAFLVPSQAAFRELGSKRSDIALSELGFLKSKYGMSMQAWIRRAMELSILRTSTGQAMLTQAKESGWEREEPIEVAFEEPSRMLRLALRAWAEGLVTESRAAELSGCPREELRQMRTQVTEDLCVGACA